MAPVAVKVVLPKGQIVGVGGVAFTTTVLFTTTVTVLLAVQAPVKPSMV